MSRQMLADPRVRRLIGLIPARLRARLLRRRPTGIHWGNVLRARPFSEVYGLDRGTAIDRYYLAQFFDRWREDVRGRTLEVRDLEFTPKFGAGVTSMEVVDIDPANERSTIVTDLMAPNSLPAESFDCFILTQTLQYIPDPVAAVRNAYSSLAPGGVLMISVPCVARIDPHAGLAADLWRFTPEGLQELVEHSAVGGGAHVEGFGTLPACLGFLLGAAAEELTAATLEPYDADFPLLACARVVKPHSTT